MGNRYKSSKRARIELQHIAANGTITDLTYGGLTWWSKQVGFGMSPIRRLMEQGPDQDGVTDLGFRLDQRTIGLVLLVTAGTEKILEAKQERLYNLFKPSDIPYSLRLIKVRPNVVRQIDCHTLSGPDFSSDEEREGKCASIYNTALQIYAPNPVFYDPLLRSQSFGLTGGGGAWSIPWAIPWSIGAGDLNQTTNIVYAGSWEEFPVITINGPITSALITNNISGDILSFSGVTIGVGEVYTIDLRVGRKTIIDALGVNQISKLTDGSDLATWSLLPDPMAPGGINPVTVSGTNVSTLTQVYISYYHRYVGGR